MKDFSEQEIVRRNSLKELVRLGINPYPSELFDVNVSSVEIKNNYNSNNEFKNIQIAGRLMSRRIMGKASFAEIQDYSGRIQLYFNRDEICPDDDKTMYNTVFKKIIRYWRLYWGQWLCVYH